MSKTKQSRARYHPNWFRSPPSNDMNLTFQSANPTLVNHKTLTIAHCSMEFLATSNFLVFETKKNKLQDVHTLNQYHLCGRHSPPTTISHFCLSCLSNCEWTILPTLYFVLRGGIISRSGPVWRAGFPPHSSCRRKNTCACLIGCFSPFVEVMRFRYSFISSQFSGQ